jgi:hypothetical protein
MHNFRSVSEKELKGIPLTDQEVTFLKTMINDYMASGPSINGWYNDLYFDPWRGLSRDFTVADVHTQPTDQFGAVVGNVLHVGNGPINMGVFLAGNPCNPKQLIAFAGPVSSFHQEIIPNFERLTDQDWEELFISGMDLPSRPDWINAYLLDAAGNLRPEGRFLKGAVYTGTGMESAAAKPVDYLLLFPNPVTEEAYLRFVLNEQSDCWIEAYDASGRQIFAGDRQHLEPAEHHITLSVGDWEPGIYLIRVGIGSGYEIRQLVVQ